MTIVVNTNPLGGQGYTEEVIVADVAVVGVGVVAYLKTKKGSSSGQYVSSSAKPDYRNMVFVRRIPFN